MQATHDESKATFNNRQAGMRLEAEMKMQEESGEVQYRLAAVVFRTGQLHNGHYFIAVPNADGDWVVLNSEKVFIPVPLPALQTQLGQDVHGLMYIRTTLPAEEDLQRLYPASSLHRSTAHPRHASHVAACL